MFERFSDQARGAVEDAQEQGDGAGPAARRPAAAAQAGRLTRISRRSERTAQSG
jgi:hypothetical protein